MMTCEKILITGADGFIGKNLVRHLNIDSRYKIYKFTRDCPIEKLYGLVDICDTVIHLAGENRPGDPSLFQKTNVGLTEKLCEAVKNSGNNSNRSKNLIFASSIHIDSKSAYGKSKAKAEKLLFDLQAKSRCNVVVLRLPNVFGKWSKPNYNSVVATFCFNIARGIPVQLSDRTKNIQLLYIDDLCKLFQNLLTQKTDLDVVIDFKDSFNMTLLELKKHIDNFKSSRGNLEIYNQYEKCIKDLYSTYISFLPSNSFSYNTKLMFDERGSFAELFKLGLSGQVSVFSTQPGAVRGRHYHHSKVEKFFVVEGSLKFRFECMITGEYIEINTHGEDSIIIESIPGWAHEVENVGSTQAITVVWANEEFCNLNPDTISVDLMSSSHEKH